MASSTSRSYGAITQNDTERLLSSVHSSISTETPLDSVRPHGDGRASLYRRRHLTKRDDPEDELYAESSVGSYLGSQVKNCFAHTCSREHLQRKLPIIKWLSKYRLDYLHSDILAGLTVALTAIPQGLAYAQVAHLPPQFGLYTAFMGSFVYCFLGTAKDLTMGPTAVMSLLTATFATDVSPELTPMMKDPTLVIILTFMTGIVQLTMGILNLGILVSFISYPVINAFTSAAAITIAFGQIKSFLGLKNISSDFLQSVYDTFSKLPETRVWDFTMGAFSLALVLILRRLRTQKWGDEPGSTPSLLVVICRKFIWLVGTGGNALVVVSAAAVAAALDSQGLLDSISVTGDITPGLPPFEFLKFEVRDGNSTWSAGTSLDKIGSGLAIVPLISLVETMAIGKAFARVNDYRIDPSQEMVANGVGNILSSFVSSFPITGSFTRTTLNSQTGVKTPLGGIFTGGIVILALCVLTPWFYYIPKAALAAVVIAAVLQMVDCHIVLTLWKSNKWDLLSFIITFVCSLAVGIEYGILIGIGFSLLLLLYPIARPHLKYTVIDDLLIITPVQGFNFPGAEFLEDKVKEKVGAVDQPRIIILNMEHISDLDFTSVQSIRTLVVDCSRHNLKLIVANGMPRITRTLTSANIKDLKIFRSLKEAFDHTNKQGEKPTPVHDGIEIVVNER